MLQYYCESLTSYKRLSTREVKIGNLLLGNNNPIRIQTMTTTNTMDTDATVAQSIRCINAGAELIRITAPSKNEAENLLHIKNKLSKMGYSIPIIADIHFTPNAAEIAARIVEKVRINPGNYVDKKRFDLLDYNDSEYNAEIERITERFTPLVRICKTYGTAMRIGTNHGSLSDRIMSRYGDTPMGMVESAMEFLRIARNENYHEIILSMKSSNPLVMVQAYRLLISKMDEEFGECYPLHLGVTEAGDGEDGRIKSAIGICSLLEDGIGDTIRVSLTEDPEFEIPVCKDIVARYTNRQQDNALHGDKIVLPYNPFHYKRRETNTIENTGIHSVPVVIAELNNKELITPDDLNSIGYSYNSISDKWAISDAAADFIYTGNTILNFKLPGTLKIIVNYNTWLTLKDKTSYLPLLNFSSYQLNRNKIEGTLFLLLSNKDDWQQIVDYIKKDKNVILIISNAHAAMCDVRAIICKLMNEEITYPVILNIESLKPTVDEQLIDLSTVTGGLLLDGFGDGIWFSNKGVELQNTQVSGRTYMPVTNYTQFLNNTAFSILQATRTRISKTEYISCPSCGRTLFDLQETTGKIRAATHHLKGVKIAIMGCIVNGPGEMADADFGYVGSGQGRITLYKGKEVVKKNIPHEIAVTELIELLKDSGVWI